ncbi:luciferase [Labrys miyagiensis]|uniref:Luciferase n=1 Tax=Labrys miyagiensis TaxID=346912 RepID=A0ABQ6CU30_9HYPH|nr:TIGR03571 family LLM class oxidoreductase [Labrys miyagiensis]GLS22229.1 luciferase [Labrys miyagiensis]
MNTTSPYELASHTTFARVFRSGKLTLGFIMPLEAYPDGPLPTLADHVERVQQVEEAGFAALWLRDIPLLDPHFGDAGQALDPFVYMGFLSAITSRIAIGTAGVVLPLRDPLILAKQATSADYLSGGRLLLGLSSGDRASEYPAFGVEFETRAERFRDAFDVLGVATRQAFPSHQSKYYGLLSGALDLIPKPTSGHIPFIAIGRSGQELEWLAANTDALISYGGDARRLSELAARWREFYPDQISKPFGYGTMFDLLDDPHAPLQQGPVLRIGRHALIDVLQRNQAEGIAHVMLNMKPCRRPAVAVIDELAEFVLPFFPTP